MTIEFWLSIMVLRFFKSMKRSRVVVLLAVVLLCSLHLTAAKKLKLYGFSDFLFHHVTPEDGTVSSFMQNRTTLILNSEFIRKWDFFFKLQFTGSYLQSAPLDPPDPMNPDEDESETYGRLELKEAWTRFSVSEKLNFRAGIFLAPFGSFNVLKDDTPSFLTIRPPLIFDDNFNRQTPVGLIPEKGNLGLSGTFHLTDVSLNYDLYVGNGTGVSPATIDYNTDKAIGARLKCSVKDFLKFGSSVYLDNAQLNDAVNEPAEMEKRVVWSFDFEVTLSLFNLYGEYMHNANESDTLGSFNRSFYYANANLRVMENVTLFVQMDRYRDESFKLDPSIGIPGGTIRKMIYGVNYKPNWKTAVKFEIQRYSYPDDKLVLVAPYTVVQGALSILF